MGYYPFILHKFTKNIIIHSKIISNFMSRNIGSWLDISGIWSQLPLMTKDLPEGWRLPSILTAVTQLAQIGPFIYLMGRWYFPKQFGHVRVIYFILIVGSISCLLLSFFWNKTEYIYGEKRSIYLYLFNFTLSLLGNINIESVK